MTRGRLTFLTFLTGLAAVGCATSPYQRAGNGDDVAAALSRSRPPETRPRSLAFLVLGGAAGRGWPRTTSALRASCGRNRRT